MGRRRVRRPRALRRLARPSVRLELLDGGKGEPILRHYNRRQCAFTGISDQGIWRSRSVLRAYGFEVQDGAWCVPTNDGTGRHLHGFEGRRDPRRRSDCPAADHRRRYIDRRDGEPRTTSSRGTNVLGEPRFSSMNVRSSGGVPWLFDDLSLRQQPTELPQSRGLEHGGRRTSDLLIVNSLEPRARRLGLRRPRYRHRFAAPSPGIRLCPPLRFRAILTGDFSTGNGDVDLVKH
jgi:hypothetical protein